MRDTTFYDLWEEALKRLREARQDAAHWRDRAERRLEEVFALRAEIEELKRGRDTRSTSCLEFRVSPGTNPFDPLR